MLLGAGSARGHQRHLAHLAHGAKLYEVIASAHAVARHAIEHDLPRAAPLRLDDPVQGAARGVARALEVARKLLYSIALIASLAVHSHHHALCPEALDQFVDQFRTLERR